jgi:hypothetical protein
MRDALLSRVLSYSKKIRAASLGFTHLVKQLYNNVQDVWTVRVPDKYFDPTFIRQLLLGTSDASVPDPDVTSLHVAFPEYLDDSEHHLGDRNIYSAGAVAYLTNLKNHMRVNLDRFMKRAIYALHPELSGPRKHSQREGHRVDASGEATTTSYTDAEDGLRSRATDGSETI